MIKSANQFYNDHKCLLIADKSSYLNLSIDLTIPSSFLIPL